MFNTGFLIALSKADAKIIDPETRHLFLPQIMTYTLIILLALILITNGKKIVNQITGLKDNWKELDFIKNWKIFTGNLILLFGYVIALNMVGFIVASVIYVFLTIVLFYQSMHKSILIKAGSIAISVPLIVWFLFGFLLKITLP